MYMPYKKDNLCFILVNIDIILIFIYVYCLMKKKISNLYYDELIYYIYLLESIF